MLEIDLRLKNDMPFTALSSSFPEVAIYRWCNSAVDYLEFHGRHEDLISIKESLPGISGKLGSHIVHLSLEKGRMSAMLACRCSIDNSTIRVIESRNGLWQAPVSYSGGYETVSVVAMDESDLASIFSDLTGIGEAEVLKKVEIRPESLRDVYMIPVSSLLGGMTGRQILTLRSALDRGYFSSPRKVMIENLAEDAGLSKSTMQEHLNKALNKLVKSMEPYLNLMIEFRKGINE